MHAQEAGADAPKADVLYRRLCQGCHGTDGRGAKKVDSFDNLPDFTNAAWHERRSDSELIASILDGKGTAMPAFQGRVTETQAKTLIRHVRGFAPTRTKKPTGAARRASTTRDFERELEKLQKQYEDLKRQIEELNIPKERPTVRPMLPAGEAYACRVLTCLLPWPAEPAVRAALARTLE
jgi:cytochrome c5